MFSICLSANETICQQTSAVVSFEVFGFRFLARECEWAAENLRMKFSIYERTARENIVRINMWFVWPIVLIHWRKRHGKVAASDSFKLRTSERGNGTRIVIIHKWAMNSNKHSAVADAALSPFKKRGVMEALKNAAAQPTSTIMPSNPNTTRGLIEIKQYFLLHNQFWY